MNGGGDHWSPCELGGERAAAGDRRYDLEDMSGLSAHSCKDTLFSRQIECISSLIIVHFFDRTLDVVARWHRTHRAK